MSFNQSILDDLDEEQSIIAVYTEQLIIKGVYFGLLRTPPEQGLPSLWFVKVWDGMELSLVPTKIITKIRRLKK